MTEIVYKLENFDSPLENSKLLFLIGRDKELPGLFNQLVDSSKTSSRVLIRSDKSEVPLFFKGEWGAVFNPGDGRDWSLVLTYCSYMARPAIIVIEDGVIVPEAFIMKLSATANLQIVRTQMLVHGLTVPSWVSAVCLPLIEEVASADADNVVELVSVLLGDKGRSGSADQKKAWLRELRVARAALIWSRIGEASQRGAVYWLDPSDGLELGYALHNRSIRKYMKSLIDHIK
jgi:hypothetical protein